MSLKKELPKFSIISVFLLLIAAPFITLQGAAKGIRLWFNVVLPSMLPCIILSNLIIKAYGRDFKNPWCYILFTGLLCGYPMGAKSCSELYGREPEKASKTQFLLALCNCSSPMFILNYCIAQTLMMKDRALLLVFILYFPIIACLIFEFVRNRNFYFKSGYGSIGNEEPCGARLSVKAVDEAIMDGFEIITKLGGYIMLFSIFSEFIQNVPIHWEFARLITCGVLEITTGIANTCAADITDVQKIILVMGYLAFGGISCIAQTKSVLAGTFYSIKKYICHKLLLAVLTILTAIIMTYVFKI